MFVLNPVLRQGVPYFQVAFKLPDAFSAMMLGKPRETYGFLFRLAHLVL